MYYVIQENLFKEYGFKALVEYLERMEIPHEFVKYIPFSETLEVKTDRKDVFFFGSSNAGMVAKKKYDWTPGHFINENFDMVNYFFHYSHSMLNIDGVIAHPSMELSKTDEMFIRPTGDGKQFTGQVFTREKWNEYARDNTSLKDILVVIAPPKRTQQEIRCWIVDGEPVTISQYRIGSRGNYLNMDHNQEAILFAKQMAKIYQPARAFCLDICLHEDEYKIVELGCINHCGFYDANMGKLIDALENMKF
jgi:hypothetical protein